MRVHGGKGPVGGEVPQRVPVLYIYGEKEREYNFTNILHYTAYVFGGN